MKNQSKKQWADKLRKLRNRITVIFESLQDLDAIAPTVIGQTYRVAEKASNLTQGQVAYRQQLARKLYGMPKGVGFAKQWRDGTSEFAKFAQPELLPAVRAMLLKELPRKRLHPTPEVAETGSEKT